MVGDTVLSIYLEITGQAVGAWCWIVDEDEVCDVGDAPADELAGVCVAP